jgi:hypothetical protein
VQHQHTGRAGRIENANVGVYLAYAGARGDAMIDRELHPPSCWTEDPERMTAARVPDGITLLTKPALATGMPTRALRTGVPACWWPPTGLWRRPTYAKSRSIKSVGDVLAIGCDRPHRTAAGPVRADELAAELQPS